MNLNWFQHARLYPIDDHVLIFYVGLVTSFFLGITLLVFMYKQSLTRRLQQKSNELLDAQKKLHERSQARLAFQYEITLLISESNKLEDTLLQIIEKICLTFSWQIGIFWQYNTQINKLACKTAWHNPSAKVTGFIEEMTGLTFFIDEGILGKAWSNGKNIWIEDLKSEKNFIRAPSALKYNISSACELPVKVNDKIYGILELFSQGPRLFDNELVNLLSILNHQIEFFITRKQNEDKLRLLSRAIESNTDGMLIVDVINPSQPIIYANPAFEDITGYSVSEVLGRNCRFLQRDDKNQPELAYLSLAQKQQKEGMAILRNYRKDNTLFWNELHITPVMDESNRVTHYVGIIRDITLRKAIDDQLLYQANYDSLTDLPNRILLEDRIEQSIAYAMRDNKTFAIYYIDLDNFKGLNDSLGYKEGDTLLKQVATRLHSCIKIGDTLARFGGDKFAIILTEANWALSVTDCAQILLDTFNEPFLIKSRNFKISASIGVSTYPKDGEETEILIKNAELAMYHAKGRGKNNYQIYTENLYKHISEQHTLEHHLQLALNKKEFLLQYQPLIHLSSNKIIGFEALLRWQHPELGLVSPLSFIPLAEQTGLIIPIGTWVLKTAMQQNKAWQDAGLPPVKIAVNISLVQFKDENFISKLQEILTTTKLAPQFLELELTESVLMENARQFIDKLNLIKEMGISLAIDDFGTGYSSLSYLKELPIDKIKIDKSFIQDIPDNADDSAITRAIISMAKNLNLRILAEGVETKEQLKFLQENHCDEVQGYLFGRPLNIEDCTELLKN
jgi:diguanylate cyclase (GGDEF)-like protein/PAS domain S-box-containing protein